MGFQMACLMTFYVCGMEFNSLYDNASKIGDVGEFVT